MAKHNNKRKDKKKKMSKANKIIIALIIAVLVLAVLFMIGKIIFWIGLAIILVVGAFWLYGLLNEKDAVVSGESA